MNMAIHTYWETASFMNAPPPYVLLSMVSMQRALGDSFTLIGPKNVEEFSDSAILTKNWSFGHNSDPELSEIRSIVAKSDYLRMHAVHERGGFWVDADTLVLNDFRSHVMAQFDEKKLLWHSEQFFGAAPGNAILGAAAKEMASQERQVWGNPGQLKDMVAANSDHVTKLEFGLFSTGTTPEYGYTTQDIVLEENIAAEDFLLNDRQCILKLYNTALSRKGISKLSVQDFLDSNILLARVFLSLEPREYWLDEAGKFVAEHGL